jgi:hypothetical protein
MEQDEWLWAARRVMVAGKVDQQRLVFVDEMGTNTSLYPLYAWSHRGERAHARVPRNRDKNTTLLASMGIEGWSVAWRSRALPPLPTSRPI